MDCSPPGSSIHEILQARTLERVVVPSSMGSSPPRDQTCVSCVTYIAGGFFTTEPPGKPFLDTRRWKDWVHNISFWKYLTIWRSFLPVPPHPQHRVPHSWSPPWAFRGVLKVSSWSSTWFNPCRSRWQMLMLLLLLLLSRFSRVRLCATP